MSDYRAAEWIGGIDGSLLLIVQTRLPGEVAYRDCADIEDVWDAIRRLQIRGAPAIGVAAAYGVVLGTKFLGDAMNRTYVRRVVYSATTYLRTSRPTAVNLFWALARMERLTETWPADCAATEARKSLLVEARSIEAEDAATCRAIGRHGADLLTDGGVLTHCNTGGLATAEYGTALGVIRTAWEQGRKLHVYADETRPLLQGARLTTWECRQLGIPVTLLCDNMAATLLRDRRVNAVVVGADRIAANGDAANKIGTYGLAVLARHHGVPFYVAAPSSSFDRSLPDGSGIPIEQRHPDEVTTLGDKPIAPDGIDVYNPAFDVTPASLITALITEYGVIRPVSVETIAAVLGSQK